MARYDGRANLMQNQEGGLSAEKARELGRLGGIASGIARRRRRQMRETMSGIMTGAVTDAQIREMLEAAGLEATNENAIALAMIAKAAHGDVEAARFVRDTLGEKPTESYNLFMEAKPIKALDLSGYTDEELERIADGLDDEASGDDAFTNSPLI